MVGTKTINYTKSCLLWSLWPWSWIKCSIKLLKFLHYCPLQRQPNTMNMIRRPRLDAILSIFVTVHPHETSILLHSSSCFFFVSLPLPSHSTLIHSFTFITYYIYIYIILNFHSIGSLLFLSFRSWAPTSWCFLCVMMVQSHWAYQTCRVSLWGPWCLLWLLRLFPLSFSLCLIFPKARYVWIEPTI